MNRDQEYTLQWDVSAEYFYNKGYYSWMIEQISSYNRIVEIGCGTGYSSLALAKAGKRVICIEKNTECIKKAKELLKNNSISDEQVLILHGDIVEEKFRQSIINDFDFDVVICWNVGTVWSKEMMEYYLPHMLEYGLQPYQIMQAPESSYVELILWETLRLARAKNAAVHIIERTGATLDASTRSFYDLLKKEFNYKNMLINEIQADSISKGGRMLMSKGVPSTENIVKIYFASIHIR